ncbi:hypothetical protein EJ06DRAFT_547612 [Trichodelitschia bisporula]|uniref:Sec23/Sec24 family protein n=1 Tax=Trichodelitschia bisporula TaxID=703511 RepID=A0A6G1I218_9PEZI|nr:hypothetical protein EJ06DRAFT_547612 [Trichodelitschia bisporula]
MSDYQMYHSLGGEPEENQRLTPAAPGFRPPVAPPPSGYHQSGSNLPPPGPPYATSPYPPQDAQQSGYFPSQPPQGNTQGLERQMSNMALGDTGAVRHKKRDRHAYHELQSTGSSQPFNGIPQTPHAAQGGIASYGTPGALTPSGSFGPPSGYGPQGTPGAQFPVPANPAFESDRLVSQAEYAARPSSSGAIASNQLDPEQLPSVPRSRDVPATYYLENLFPTMESMVPPPASVPFAVFDQGNSSPKFARLSMTHIPVSAEALAAVGLPLGMTVQPLAPLQEGEQEVPVLDYGDVGPPRCRRCRAYINPFMTFRSGGNKFVCNLCTFPNETPMEYFAPTDPTGVRVDRLERPELMLGTVEFIVPKEYYTREPVPLHWLFMIDVTEESVNKHYLEGFCDGILKALYGDSSKEDAPRKLAPGVKVGIVTFDKQMHFYNLSSNLHQAQMMVMPDIDDPFVPLSEGLFVDPEDSRAVITSLLTQLPQMFSPEITAGLKNPEPALLPALDVAVQALTATGGKIVCSLAALPTWGPGRLFLRDENAATAGTDAEKKLLTTEHPGYTKLAARMVEAGVGADFFLASPSGGYLDIATIGFVSAKTGGEVYYYPNFQAQRDTLRLAKEIDHTVSRATGYQALMKVRCSNGLQVSAYHGNFTHHTFGADLEFGVIDADKAIGIMFSYDGKLDPKLDAHFQCATLYTTESGQRRVRCHNLVASVADSGAEAIKFVDQDAIVSLIAKEAASRVPERSLKDVRNAITEKTVDILAGYRKNFSSSNPVGQLVIPENLKELSMYMLALIKCRAFKGGREPSDRRIHDVRLVRAMGPGELSLYLYPRIIALHDLAEGDGFANENGHLRMPATQRASFARINDGGAYIVDNGQTCLLWLHTHVAPALLEDLFGPGHNTLASIDPFSSALPVLDTHLNAQVRNILAYLALSRGGKVPALQIARQGLDGAEFEFARLLVEDRNNEAQSYVDWLVHLHRLIQLEMAGQRKKKDEAKSDESLFVGLRTPYWG